MAEPKHQNAFGFLRLLFASLVIVSHTPELTDGNTHREILASIFGTTTFGGLAVDGFFVISGYLIAGSFLKKPKPWAYLEKRVRRIYPGFIVASLVCLVIVAPLSGAPIQGIADVWKGSVKNLVLLFPPYVPGMFADLHYAALNGSMWTIAYEFRCYLLILALGVSGLLNRPTFVAAAAFVLFALCALVPAETLASAGELPGSIYWLGGLDQTIRLTGVFLVGALFYLIRDRLRFTRAMVIAASAALLACMFVRPLTEPGIAVFGGYLILTFADWGKGRLVSRINNEDDVSYGVYLYAFPIEQLLLLHAPGLPLVATGLLTFAGAYACGWLSWRYVEKPAMRFRLPHVAVARSWYMP